MTNVSVRKTNWASWTEEALKCTAEPVLNKKLSLRKASKLYKTPPRTRIKNNYFSKKKTLGPASQLGLQSEQEINKTYSTIAGSRFCSHKEIFPEIAFNLAVSLGVKRTFNCEKKFAGKLWLSSFLRRNPELSIRKAEEISRART